MLVESYRIGMIYVESQHHHSQYCLVTKSKKSIGGCNNNDTVNSFLTRCGMILSVMLAFVPQNHNDQYFTIQAYAPHISVLQCRIHQSVSFQNSFASQQRRQEQEKQPPPQRQHILQRSTFVLHQSTTPSSSSSTSISTASTVESESVSPPESSSPSPSSVLFNNDPNIQYTVMNPNVVPTDEWELDCYSRPVIMKDDNNKKLWQILITDSIGSFRYVHRLPSNQVNSKTVRQVVDTLMEYTVVKPNTIRFFRGAMFNMIQIALSELPNITSKPSRCTFALSSWLEELYQEVYPKMEGYNSNMITSGSTSNNNAPSFLDVRTPIKLPDALRGEKYAFVSLPLQEFLPYPDDMNNENDGNVGITSENIGVGRLCPIPQSLLALSSNTENKFNVPAAAAAADIFVQGVVILSSRAPALAAWLAGTEVVALQADLRKRILTMETDIDNQYLMAKLNDQQRLEAVAFEEGKDMLQGLHFISVQKTEDDDPEGFWLLRELPRGI
jgi:RNA-binding protein Tab2/Atab2